jgi:hypothetical protein
MACEPKLTLRPSEESTVSGESQPAHQVPVTLERDKLLLIGHVPELDGSILAAGARATTFGWCFDFCRSSYEFVIV